jgi:peroxiredoxin
VREHRADLERLGAGAIAVSFSPAQPLALLAKHLEWPWPFLSDPHRLAYARLRVPRAPLRDVYTAGTLQRYARAVLHRQRIRRPVEDTRQLGADAVVVDGHAVRILRSRSPDDRPAMETLLEALASVR